MRNAILMLLFAAVAFGASAAGSFVLKSKSPPAGNQEATDEASASTSTGDQQSGTPTSAATPDADLPVAVRPRPMSVEEVLRFGMGLRKREEQLDSRAKALNEEQARMQLALADIRGEQQQIEGMQARLQGQAEICRSILGEIQQARQNLAADRDQAKEELNKFEEVRLESDAEEQQNIKTMSEWFRGMEPEKAAGAIKKLANEGKTDLAVKILSNFEERDAAKILSALDDYALMVELAEKFKSYKRPPRKEAARRR
ncbi:MAG: hypothetical protein KF861_03595 [Planctomycetaceae bacterium]|nr:hypothetical protein [Planctomycetaceae bacterium]